MIPQIKMVEIILYVSDQETSRRFYGELFRQEPELHAPGMTEFIVSGNVKIGLMPNNGIAKILGGKVPHPGSGKGIPRCELYLYVDNIGFEFENALNCGALLLSPVALRDWGDNACYFADPDGHIIAFAEKPEAHG